MKLIYISVLFAFLPLASHAQELTLLTTLNESIKESSGLIYLNGNLITHNDSGGEPKLYELDSITGNTTREVTISNATNIDWEDLCYDNTYIYIADFGNNNGSRTDLKVYRILISDYFTSPNDMVTAEIINFSYLDQTDFTPSPYATNYDAEALISFGENLYVFTKNWGDNWTNIYKLPKIPGTYQIEKQDSINAQGLVTGATFNAAINTVVLTGYTFISAFIIEISDFTNDQFANGTIDKYSINTPAGASYQIESITHQNQNQYFLTAEESTTGNSALYKLETSEIFGIEDHDKITAFIYPNPARNNVTIDYSEFSVVEIYDLRGKLQKTANKNKIDISKLKQGLYLLIIKDASGKRITTKKLVVK